MSRPANRVSHQDRPTRSLPCAKPSIENRPVTSPNTFATTSTSSAPILSREEYFAERQLLIEARQRSYQRAEQMIVGGATGALLLSITFLEKLAPGPGVARPGLLVAAWLILLVCLSVSLLGHYLSARAFDCEMSRLDAKVNGETLPKNKWAACNQACGGASAVFLVVGIALLAWFAFINAPFS
jgi:hypothetical protein